MKKYDSVIIGSGVSGLTAALILAQNGKRVAIVEQNSYIAPLLRRFKRAGVWCDPGFHYTGGFEPGGTLSVLFRYLGIYDNIRILPMNPDCFDIISLEGNEDFLMPYGFERIRDALCTRFPDSRKAIETYLNKLDDINRKTPFTNFDLDFGELPNDVYKNQSLRDFLLQAGAEEDLIRLLGNHGIFLYSATESEVPVFVHAYIMGSFYRSSSTIIQGGDAIVDAYQTRLEQEGVDIYYNDPVISIKIDDFRKLRGVETKQGMFFECNTCISTIHPQLLIDIIPKDKLRPAYINRLKNLENTLPPFVIFYDLDEAPVKISEMNYYRYKPGKDSSQSPDYLALMSVNQKTETTGKKSLAVIKPCDPDLFKEFFSCKNTELDNKYLDLKNSFKEKVTNEIFELFPELKGHTRVVDAATPVTYNRYTGTVNGSIYGVKQTVNKRALTTMTAIKGFYIAGQSIQSGVMGAVVSGFMAVLNIIEPQKIRSGLKKCC